MRPFRNQVRGRRPLQVRRALRRGAIARASTAGRLATIACVAGALVAALVSLPAAAVADGDPASDVLLTENVFYSYSPGVSAALTAALNTTVARAHAAGFPIKVALIEAPLDLGAIPQLFGKPEQYAKFLDYEISYNSVAKLLVVMPQGFGTYASGPVSALSGIRVDAAARTNGLAEAAIVAIGRLAKLAGHPIAIPSPPNSGGGTGASGNGGSPLVLVLAIVGLIALSCAALAIRQRKRRAVSARERH